MIPVIFHGGALADDLAHLPSTAHRDLDALTRQIERDGGIDPGRLKRCQAEGRDGTRLPNCVKTYVPWPDGRFGLVFVAVAHPIRPLALRCLAYGHRHPEHRRLSVYRIAHDRLHA